MVLCGGRLWFCVGVDYGSVWVLAMILCGCKVWFCVSVDYGSEWL